MSIRFAVGQFKWPSENDLRFAVQLGASGVQVNCPPFPGETFWEETHVRSLVERVEAAGLKLEAIENVPVQFYDKVMLGKAGRDAQIENYITTMRSVAAAGVPILGHHFMPNSVWRTNRKSVGRGGAECSAFDMEIVETAECPQDLRSYLPSGLGNQAAMPIFSEDKTIDAEAMRENYLYFMQAVLPVANEIGLKLALHPDDPPVPKLGGVARIFRNLECFRTIEDAIGATKAWGLNLCLGTISEMEGGAQAVHDMIAHFGPRGRIFYVHFRDVLGSVPKFRECFVDEGNYDACAVMEQLFAVGFDGFILDDHVPRMQDDSEWGHRGRAYAIGYIKGILDMNKRNLLRL